MTQFRQITIIGTGLIGGSFALAAKKAGFRGKIIGCDRQPILSRAKKLRVVDIAIADPIHACQGSDLVILATPVGGIIELIEKLAPHLSSDTLLTDVGSTKSEIMLVAQRAFGDDRRNQFLGGHPMAGKENSGVEFADAKLFTGAVWFFTPTADQGPRSRTIAAFSSVVKQIGAKIIALEAREHDRLCAWISHVPQMISTAMAAALVEEYGPKAPLLEAGGRALREMTRIAASPYSMWRDIAITNKAQIAEALLKVEQELGHIRENLDTRELEMEFERAHQLKSAANGKASKKQLHARG